MKIRMDKTEWSVYALDFETHADEESRRKRETGIWLSCMIDESDRWTDDVYDYTIPQLFSRLEKLSRKSPLLVYVYNLAFEWSFMLPFVLSYGFKWRAEIRKDSPRSYNSVSNTTAMTVWEATMKFDEGCHIIQFRDLSKIFAGGLGRVAKSFGLPDQKESIDYEKNRLHGYVVTDEEKHYCYNDVKIVMDILERMKDEPIFWKSLSSSSFAIAKMVEQGFPRSKNAHKSFRSPWNYPELEQEETEFLRKSVSGGITYPTPAYQFKDIRRRIIHIDAHQMHPSSAYLNPFPCGKGQYFKGPPRPGDYYIDCVHVKVSYTGVKLHSVIKLIGIDFADDVELWLWDFEIPTMRKCYEGLKVEYIDGYRYKAKMLPWRAFYNKNYHDRQRFRKEGNEVQASLRKLWNNGSYGKLLEHGHETEYENFVYDDGTIRSVEHPIENPSLNAKYTYLPVGSCIPAYSRVKLIETALLFGYKNVIYFDTDSIFAIDCEESREALTKIDMQDHLGGWGREADIDRGEFDAPKRYKIKEEGTGLTVHSAGFDPIQKDEKGRDYIDYADGRYYVDDGHELFDALNLTNARYFIRRAYRVKGGTMILFQLKEMGVQEKYASAYEKNKGAIIE